MFQTVSSNDKQAALRVPDFFPKTSKGCLPTSEKFFQCFTESSFITPANNTVCYITSTQVTQKCVFLVVIIL